MSIPNIAISEDPKSTWEKRFFQRHYSYQDSHTVSTVPLTENAMLALVAAGLATTPVTTSSNVYYVFGTNALLVTNPTVLPWGTVYGTALWPATCYARELLMHCTEDAFIKIVSINPEYLKEYVLSLIVGYPPTSSSQLLFGRELPLLAGNIFRFFPTYGYAITFRAGAAGNSGTLNVWIEGNVEGDES